MTKYVGVDGCRSGWFAVELIEPDVWRTAVYRDVEALWNNNTDAALILIDMPIGVLDTGTDRPCDYIVRRLLGKRKSSVFPMPCRAALYAAAYDGASQVNFEKTGKKLSAEMWNIMPKTRDLNDFLARNRNASEHVRETHPELCLAGLNGGNPMAFAKKKERELAFAERLAVLASYYPGSGALIEKAGYPRKDVARDDIVDALALAITASRGLDHLTVIKSQPEHDSKGLLMQMVYYLKRG
jgi:predicted RNase H-like nuclease